MKLVVFSIDQYSHLGPLFLQYLNDKWPECPYDHIYIAQNRKIDVPHPVVYIRGPAMDFGRRMRTFLRQHYTDDTLLIMMIDYIPKSANHSLLVKSAKVLSSSPDIGHVRLRPMPKPSRLWPADPDFGIVDKHLSYSLSLQPGMWDSQLLYDLCRDGENAWHTETHGSTRTKNFSQLFLSTMSVAIGHHNWYRKGRADPIPKTASWRIQ